MFNVLEMIVSEKVRMSGSDEPRLSSNPTSSGRFMSSVNNETATPVLGSTERLSTSLATPLVRNKNVLVDDVARSVLACKLLISTEERAIINEVLLVDMAEPPVSL